MVVVTADIVFRPKKCVVYCVRRACDTDYSSERIDG